MLFVSAVPSAPSAINYSTEAAADGHTAEGLPVSGSGGLEAFEGWSEVLKG